MIRSNADSLYVFKLYFFSYLSRQRELERHAEVVGRGGVRRGGHHGDVGLMVKVGVQGEHTREGVVGRKGDLQRLVAAGGLGAQGLDVAAQGALVAP